MIQALWAMCSITTIHSQVEAQKQLNILHKCMSVTELQQHFTNKKQVAADQIWPAGCSLPTSGLQQEALSMKTNRYMHMLSHSVVFDSASLWMQPVRLLCPWSFPGKNTGVGCHFLLQGILSTPGLTESKSPASPALAGRFFTTEPHGKL